MSVVKNKLKIPLRVSSHLHPLLIQKNHVPYLYCKTQKQESKVSCDKLYSLNGAELWECHLHRKNDFEALAQNTMCSYYFFFYCLQDHTSVSKEMHKAGKAHFV